jgi:hypothetical protein
MTASFRTCRPPSGPVAGPVPPNAQPETRCRRAGQAIHHDGSSGPDQHRHVLAAPRTRSAGPAVRSAARPRAVHGKPAARAATASSRSWVASEGFLEVPRIASALARWMASREPSIVGNGSAARSRTARPIGTSAKPSIASRLAARRSATSSLQPEADPRRSIVRRHSSLSSSLDTARDPRPDPEPPRLPEHHPEEEGSTYRLRRCCRSSNSARSSSPATEPEDGADHGSTGTVAWAGGA